MLRITRDESDITRPDDSLFIGEHDYYMGHTDERGVDDRHYERPTTESLAAGEGVIFRRGDSAVAQ